MEKDDTGGERSTDGRDERCIRNVGRKTWREEATQMT
jgi:hypothetical protein